jgi:hypothetical protein
MTSSDLEPATFRLVALHLNQLRHRAPPNRNSVTEPQFIWNCWILGSHSGVYETYDLSVYNAT